MPGITVVCGDSHTSTHGAFGAMAFGIGTSEVEHVLATQTLPLKPFKTMAITVEGELKPGVTAKDIILAVIAKIGTNGGQGYVLEFRGSAIRALSMEGRMTICNMSIEAGARAGMVAPDETTFAYVKDKPHAPQGQDWEDAVAYWRTLPSDEGAVYDAEVFLDADALEPFVTWGTNPGQGVSLSDVVPAPEDFADPNERAAAERALEYMDLVPGHAAQGRRRRRGVHGVVHEQPHRGPPGFRVSDRGADEGRGRARDGGPGLGARAAGGRGRGTGQGVPRLRSRVALRRVLDVPRHEPRSAGTGGALRLDQQPQLRGPSGQGRAHTPRVSAGRGRDRRPRASRQPRPICPHARRSRPDMEAFETHTGIAAPLRRSAVDTDQIIPAVYLKRVTKTGFEDALFANWRQDPDFVLNRPEFARASVLVAGPDFGTGSSREHAVWALRDFGFRVVLSTKFADIFRGNAGKQGLVTGVVSEADLEAIWAAIDARPGATDDGRPPSPHRRCRRGRGARQRPSPGVVRHRRLH